MEKTVPLKYDKIMAGGSLDDIVGRLTCCHAVLDVIRMDMEAEKVADAIAGACDLLNSIIRDFQADIDSAEDYPCPEGG